MKRSHYSVTFAVLAAANIAYAMVTTVVAPALPEIQRDLGASSSTAAWLFTGYLVSASVLTPIVGRLGDMFGKERTLVVVLVTFALGGLLGALANSIEVLIAARVVQGIGGAVFPLAAGIIRDEFPAHRANFGIAFLSALLGVGGGAGIVLAGPIISALGYHWLFWLPVGIGVLATLGTIFLVPESPLRSPGRVDWAGLTLLSVWLVLLLIGITRASTWGWLDARTLAMIAGALVLLAGWIRLEWGTSEPLIDMRLARRRSVWTVNASAFLIGGGIYAAFVLFPQFTETGGDAGYGFDASISGAGLFLLPLPVMVLFFSFASNRIAERIGNRLVLIAGCLISGGGFLFFAAFHSRPLDAYAATTIIGIGIGLAFAALATLIVASVPPDHTGEATGVNAVMRTVGGAVGAQICASILAGSAAAGVASASGFSAAFVVVGVSALLAAAAGLLIPAPPRRVPAEVGAGATAAG